MEYPTYRFIGKSLPRREDDRLIRGLGQYTSDLARSGHARLYVIRSPYAAADFIIEDTSAASSLPGVHLVLTPDDPEISALGTFTSRVRRQTPDGTPNFEPPYRALTRDRARFVGDPVAAIVADTIEQAKDAADALAIEWNALEAVVETKSATEAGRPIVWPEAPGNICFVEDVGDPEATNKALESAKHVVTLSYPISRVTAAPLETRAALAEFDPRDEMFTLTATLQNPHYIREELAERVLGINGNSLRVIAPDVGGAFGVKESPFPEYVLALIAARRLRRPVLWISDRNESFLGDHHARDHFYQVTLGLNEKGDFVGLQVEAQSNIGAYIAFNGLHTPVNNIGGLSGVYRTPHIHARITGVFTHTSPTSPYRGAGRPEAIYAIERAIDLAARRFGFDRLELRRRNMIAAEEMPYDTGFVYTYDSGEFARNMDDALELGDWAGFTKRKERARTRNRLTGIGIANAIEIANGPIEVPHTESAELRFDSTGSLTVYLGTHSQGQGHETTFAQIACDLLGLEPQDVKVRYGDTEQIEHGIGTFGSRSAAAGSVAMERAARSIIDRGKLVAAAQFEVPADEISYDDGFFQVTGTNQRLAMKEVARLSYRLRPEQMEGRIGLAEKCMVAPNAPTFPNGCHICEVEIDPETGDCQLKRYAVVDDVGRVVNPIVVEGQIHGGVVQGIGQILLENIAYDVDGQLLSGSFMDYGMPRASDVPSFLCKCNEVLTTTNPLGVKGAGEAGIVGALAALSNAIVDALSEFGVEHIEMPATPERIWKAIHSARVRAPSV